MAARTRGDSHELDISALSVLHRQVVGQLATSVVQFSMREWRNVVVAVSVELYSPDSEEPAP